MAKLPTVVTNLAPDLRAFVNRVREAIDGKDGNRLVSVNDLVRGGIAGTGPGGTLAPPTTGVVGTPPAPKNVTVTAGVYSVFVEWDDPRYYGHAYAEVWGAATDNIGAAVSLGMAPGVNFVDTLDPDTVRYYWVRFVNILGVIGAYNAIAGKRAQTAPEVGHLLDVLAGSITESELYSGLNSRIDKIEVNTTAIQTETTVRAAADSSLASQITTVSAVTNANTAAIQTEATARTNADSALSQQITTVQASVGSNTTAIQQEATARVNADNSLFAQYTVKIDTNGYVSGFGLASTANNATPFSDFAIRADRFYVASPTGPGITPMVPFTVVTTPQVIDGTNIPVGVYINGAFIKGGSIQGSAIVGGTIEGTKLINVSADKITGAALLSTSYIESAGYIPGSQGWKIGGNGVAEFAAASIRGQLVAGQIDTRGLTIKNADGTVIFSSGGVDYTNVIGTKPPSNATRNAVFSTSVMPSSGVLEGDVWNDTSSTQAKVWLYLSGAWRLTGTEGATFAAGYGQIAGQISSSNISTYIASAAITEAFIGTAAITEAKIASAAITSAKIGFAAVETLKIAGNAVTVPSTISADLNVDVAKNGGFVWQALGSLDVDFGSVAPSATITLASINVLFEFGSGSTASYIRIREEYSGAATSPNGITHTNSVQITVGDAFTTAFTGNRRFIVEISQLTIGAYYKVGSANLTVLGAKR